MVQNHYVLTRIHINPLYKLRPQFLGFLKPDSTGKGHVKNIFIIHSSLTNSCKLLLTTQKSSTLTSLNSKWNHVISSINIITSIAGIIIALRTKEDWEYLLNSVNSARVKIVLKVMDAYWVIIGWKDYIIKTSTRPNSALTSHMNSQNASMESTAHLGTRLQTWR